MIVLFSLFFASLLLSLLLQSAIISGREREREDTVLVSEENILLEALLGDYRVREAIRGCFRAWCSSILVHLC